MLDNESFFYTLNQILQKFLDDPYTNKKLAYDLQMNLLDRIILIEQEIKKNQEIIEKNKEITKNKATETSTRRELSIHSKTLKNININYKEDMKKLRGIGDSIAFSYFSKYDLKALCWKQSPGFIGGKKGLEKELELFESYFEAGEFAILNDITNSLRFGDITIDKNGKPYLLEVKTSNFVDRRVIKQGNDIKEKLSMIHSDYIKNFEGSDLTFKRVHSKKNEINYIDLLQDMIKESLLTGESFTEIEKGLTYIVLYNINEQNSNEYNHKLTKTLKSFNNPYVFCLNFLKSYTENYTPFPVIIKDPVALEEFYYGNLLITIAVDIDVLKNKLNSLDYNLKSKDDEGLKISFDFNGKDTEIIVGNYHFIRLGRELLSLDWFISSIDDVIKDIRSNF